MILWSPEPAPQAVMKPETHSGNGALDYSGEAVISGRIFVTAGRNVPSISPR